MALGAAASPENRDQLTRPSQSCMSLPSILGARIAEMARATPDSTRIVGVAKPPDSMTPEARFVGASRKLRRVHAAG